MSETTPAVRKVRGAQFKPQLYNLEENPSEQKDVLAANPEVASRLAELLRKYREHGVQPLRHIRRHDTRVRPVKEIGR